MVKKEKPAAPKKDKKPAIFPWGKFIGGVALIGLGIISYKNIFTFPKLAYEVILIIVGLISLRSAFSTASNRRRKEIAKKYI